VEFEDSTMPFISVPFTMNCCRVTVDKVK